MLECALSFPCHHPNMLCCLTEPSLEEKECQSPQTSSRPASADEILLLPYYSLAVMADASNQADNGACKD